MGMVPFYTRFRELAFQEMRNATIQGWEDLPDGERVWQGCSVLRSAREPEFETSS